MVIPIGGAVTNHLSTLNHPADVKFDAFSRTLYWCEENAGLIRKAAFPLAGGTLTAQPVFSGLTNPYYLDVDLAGQKIYWGSSGAEIRSGPLSGGSQDAVALLSTGLNVRGVCYDAATTTLYWCEKDASSIFMRKLPDGTKTTLYAGQNAPHGLVLDLSARKLYWTDTGTNSGGFNPRGISRGDLDGGGAAEKILTGTTTNQPWDVDLDLRHATYADWTTRVFRKDATIASKLPDQDPDSDGLNNLLEYALDGAPLFPDQANLPKPLTVEVSGTAYPAIQYLRRPSVTDLTYKVQVASDLSTWIDNSTVEVSSTLRPAGDIESVVARSAEPLTAIRQYLRVKVSSVP